MGHRFPTHFEFLTPPRPTPHALLSRLFRWTFRNSKSLITQFPTVQGQKCRSRAKCSFGCPRIDAVFGGGLPTQDITEIAGAAGTGKTQFCLQLAYQCQLPESDGGLNGNAAYLCCGEGEFPISRYCELIKLRRPMCSRAETIDFLNGLHIEKCHTVDDMILSLKKTIPTLCDKMKLKLLVVDSIAGLIRTEYDTRDIASVVERTRVLFVISSTLKWISDIFSISIVVINQVTDQIDGGVELRPQTTSALGLAWKHCVNNRVLLERSRRNDYRPLSGVDSEKNHSVAMMSVPREQYDDDGADAMRSSRKLMVLSSPFLPYDSCHFNIAGSGVHGLGHND